MNHKPGITSMQNPLVKQVLRLQQKAAERKKTGLFVVEGRREVSLALTHGVNLHQLLLCPEVFTEDPAYPVLTMAAGDRKTVYVSRAVYNRMAYRGDAEGVLMLGEHKSRDPLQLTLPDSPLIVVLEAVEKPGNLGAVLRTADAAGVDAVVLADARTDLYNPNVIRSSLGCVFTLPVVSCSSSEAIAWLTNAGSWPGEKQPRIYAAALQTDTLYYDSDMRGPSALVFGAEDKGLSAPWQAAAHQTIKIPMSGSIDSLNIGASVAVLCFEARRQRQQQANPRAKS
ncbi:MAG: RNA methyltransferase [Bacteroidales bacterium]|nr:RNA methyltransferase [Bacteroidales bacterium]